MTSIDESAPAVTRESASVEAPPSVVFETVADVEDWPSWQESVSSVEVHEPVGIGTTFRWRSGGSRIVSTIELFDRPNAIGWNGRSLGIRAVHIWRFVGQGSGTRVDTEESFEGWLASVLRPLVRRVLRRSVETAVLDLKREAERRAAQQAKAGLA